MQQSLLTKMQGGMAGMYIAQKIRPQRSEASSIDDATTMRQQEKSVFKNYALLAGASIESIIHCRRVNLDDWIVATNRLIAGDGHGIAIAPIALYLHDDIPLLQNTIRQIGDRYRLDKITIDSLLFLGTAIAYLLGERCTSATLIPAVLDSLPPSENLLPSQLRLIQEYAIDNSSELPTVIPAVITEISRQQHPYILPVAMATYCFLCTPTNYKVAVQRAAQIPRQPFITLALTGLLVGTANGFFALPPSWYTEGLRGADQLVQLAERLLATWAGVYQPGMLLPEQQGIVATPGIMQRR